MRLRRNQLVLSRDRPIEMNKVRQPMKFCAMGFFTGSIDETTLSKPGPLREDTRLLLNLS